jgi:two-component system sensor histidine kinase/response regulator
MTVESFSSQDIPSILIVDDIPANLELLSEMLRERGYEPRPVPSGRLAMLAAQADPPDLIMLDIRMPEMNGFEVCERMKADAVLKDIPIIFITALTDTAEKVKAFSLGAVDYVTKPFQVEEIVARVRAHLSIYSLQRQLCVQNLNLEQRVADRTLELAKAYERLLELGRLKNDFFRIISYEIRTPVNGVLGIGELIIDRCPASDDCMRYAGLFREASLRMRNLIEDMALIIDIEEVPLKTGEAVSFSVLLDSVRASLPGIQISMDQQAALESVFLKGDRVLLKRVLQTMILLATSLSMDRYSVRVTGVVEAEFLRVNIDVDDFLLSAEAVVGFFDIESLERSKSSAETLGLAPVVAHKIISALGGEMRLVKGEENTGHLTAIFFREPNHV